MNRFYYESPAREDFAFYCIVPTAIHNYLKTIDPGSEFYSVHHIDSQDILICNAELFKPISEMCELLNIPSAPIEISYAKRFIKLAKQYEADHG